MDTTDDLRQDFEERPVMQGTSVYDANGDKVGEVSDRGLQQNALIVEKGFFFPREVYVPLSAIRGRAADGIHLSLTKDAIGSHNWDASAGADAPAVGVHNAGTESASLPINRNVAVPISQQDLAAEKQHEEIQATSASTETPADIQLREAESSRLDTSRVDVNGRSWDQTSAEGATSAGVRSATPINPATSAGGPVGLSGGAPQLDARDKLADADSSETADTFNTPDMQP